MLGWIFTVVMTYGGALAALFNPYIGFLIYVAFSILNPESLWFWAVPQGNYSAVVAIALSCGWVIRGTGRWQLGRSRGIVFALVGYWVWSILSAASAPNKDVAWLFVEGLSKIVLPFVIGITLIESVRDLKQLTWVIALAHAFLGYEFNLSYYEGANRLMTAGHAGMDEVGVAVAMVTASGLVFFLALNARRWWIKALLLGALLLIVHVILFSYSRGGMLGLAVSAAVGFWLLPKRPASYLMFALVAALSFRLAGQEVRQEFMTTFAEEQNRDSSAQSRIDLWADALDSMAKQPMVGLGPDHFPLIAEQYGWPQGKEAHNLWLQIGAELGIPGILFLLSFYGLCVVRLWSFLRDGEPVEDPWLREAARMVIVSLAGFGVATQFISLEGLEVPYYITLIGAGVLKLSSAAKTRPSETALSDTSGAVLRM